MRKLTEQTRKTVYKFNALDTQHLVLLTEDEGQRVVDKKQVEKIKKQILLNPNNPPLSSQFVAMDHCLTPKAALQKYHDNSLRVGVTGGQHNLIAIREIHEADPEFFKLNNLSALTIEGKLYALGGITAFNEVFDASKGEDEATVQFGSMKVFYS